MFLGFNILCDGGVGFHSGLCLLIQGQMNLAVAFALSLSLKETDAHYSFISSNLLLVTRDALSSLWSHCDPQEVPVHTLILRLSRSWQQRGSLAHLESLWSSPSREVGTTVLRGPARLSQFCASCPWGLSCQVTVAPAAGNWGDGQPVLRHTAAGMGSTLFKDPESLMISFRLHRDMPSRPRDAFIFSK